MPNGNPRENVERALPIRQNLDDSRVPSHRWTSEVEPGALAQLRNMTRLPIIHGHVAAMPNEHASNAGIGCGMVAARHRQLHRLMRARSQGDLCEGL